MHVPHGVGRASESKERKARARMPGASAYKIEGTLHIESACPSGPRLLQVLPARANHPKKASPTTQLHPCTTRPTLYGRPSTTLDVRAISHAPFILASKHQSLAQLNAGWEASFITLNYLNQLYSVFNPGRTFPSTFPFTHSDATCLCAWFPSFGQAFQHKFLTHQMFCRVLVA